MDIQTLPQVSIPPLPLSKPSQASASSEPTPNSPKHQATCPFAVLSPTAPAPPGHPPIERRCPRWVRVLRFSAKLVAKQVVLRTFKKALKGIFASLRKNDAVAAIEPAKAL